MIDTGTTWIVIIGLAVGSYLIRFSFLGIIGDRPLPDWLLRHLRYTAVAILPGIFTPLILWPDGAGSDPDPIRILAALVTLGVGWKTGQVLAAIAAGALTLYGGLWLTG